MPITNLISITEESIGSEVVSLDYVKQFASIETTDHDELLTNLIKSARTEIEKVGRISLNTRTITAEWSEAYTYVNLPKPKIASITSVTVDGEDLVLNDSYKVKGGDKKQVYGDFPNGVVIEYEAGYGDDTPEDLKLAIVKHVLESFEHRTGISIQNSLGINLLPNNWRATVLNYRPTWMAF